MEFDQPINENLVNLEPNFWLTEGAALLVVLVFLKMYAVKKEFLRIIKEQLKFLI